MITIVLTAAAVAFLVSIAAAVAASVVSLQTA
jgi:hypothetical protein